MKSCSRRILGVVLCSLLAATASGQTPAPLPQIAPPPSRLLEGPQPPPPSAVLDSLSISDQSTTSTPVLSEVVPFEISDLPPESAQTIPSEVASPVASYQFGDWLGYNTSDCQTTWLAAGNDLSFFSMQSQPALALGEKSGIKSGTGFHFLSGPGQTDMPPRLFDLELAFLSRSLRSDHFMLDLKVGVGIFTDFEGSARKGVRFPGHLVGYYEVDPDLAGVLGVEVLDRDDITMLPVAGFVWRSNCDLVWELVFPRPKVQYRFNETHAFYTGAELGGDSWAIERVGGIDDVATYRDIRITCGIMSVNQSANSSVFEIGYALARKLQYRSGNGDYEPDSAILFGFRSNF